MEAVRGPIRAVGRVALAAMFISGGADAFLDPGPRTTKAAELGVPLDPELAVRVNGAAMASAGVALALGVLPRLAAAVLAGTLVQPPLQERRPVRRGAAGAQRAPEASSRKGMTAAGSAGTTLMS